MQVAKIRNQSAMIQVYSCWVDWKVIVFGIGVDGMNQSEWTNESIRKVFLRRGDDVGKTGRGEQKAAAK